jgi:DNA mismatch repair protein MutS
MCGVPIHAFENYLPKLLRQGFSCVVVEQVEEASEAKGLVKREVTRIITPGVRLDGEGLDEKIFNYLSAIIPNGIEGGIYASIEVSTGVLLIREAASVEDMENLLYRYAPREILLPFKDPEMGIFDTHSVLKAAMEYARSAQVKISHRTFSTATIGSETIENDLFDKVTIDDEKKKEISEHIKTRSPSFLRCISSLLSYVKEISLKVDLCVSSYSYEGAGSGYVIDAATRRNLELSEASFDGDRKFSVLGVIDKTRTAAGGRLLQDWILAPLSSREDIEERLDAVEEITRSGTALDEVRKIFTEVRDIERLSTRISGNRATPYDFGLLRASLQIVPGVKNIIGSFKSQFLNEVYQNFDTLEDVSLLLERAFVEDLPPKFGERDVIRDSYHGELERLRSLRKNAQGLLTRLEVEEKSKTGIQTLRIKHNSVFGYFIEISKGQLAKVPDTYVRRQTLTNAERFITPELKTLEQEILSSKTRLYDLERQLFTEVRMEVAKASLRLQRLARSLAVIDVLFSFAHVSLRNGYVRPTMVDDAVTEVKGGRHPVVEHVCGRPHFVPNDSLLVAEDKGFAVLSGPNMGGKSTYLRQLGIIHVLAQSGCFVPAKEAVIGVADKIFTRIGSGDALAKGESTFMVEMKEAAHIIRNATEKSIVLIDEIGRGTATADGLALATAISHWLIDKIRCRTVFATHFHELTSLPEYSSRAFCLSVGIVETRNNIEFTHRIENKVSKKSYGIHVAKLAGVPDALIKEAMLLLSQLRAADPSSVEAIEISSIDSASIPSDLYEVLAMLKKIQPEHITPLQAIELIYDISKKVKNSEFSL